MAGQVLRFVIVPAGDAEFGELIEDGHYQVAVDFPKSARLLGEPKLTSKGVVVYAIADPDDGEIVNRHFVVIGNGRDLPEGCDELGYRGTIKLMPGAPTFHLFEVQAVTA